MTSYKVSTNINNSNVTTLDKKQKQQNKQKNESVYALKLKSEFLKISVNL
jgi:hypothetical protein